MPGFKIEGHIALAISFDRPKHEGHARPVGFAPNKAIPVKDD